MDTVAFRPIGITEELTARMKEGDSAGTVAREALERYFALLGRTLSGIKHRFTVAELCLLADAANGVLFQASSIPLYHAEVEDAIKLGGIDGKWQVDGASLVAKLKNLSNAEMFALVDALERWWIERRDATVDGFATVGLVAKA